MKMTVWLLGVCALSISKFSIAQIEESAEPLPDRYIVVLKPDSASSGGRPALARLAQALLARHRGTVHRVYGHALWGFSARMSRRSAALLAADPRVAFVEEDGIVRLAADGAASWGLDRIDQRDLPLDGIYGSTSIGGGVNVYVIDTGIRSSHVELAGRVLEGFTAVRDGRGTLDCNGHGTHVSGTIGGASFGVAPGVLLVPVRVLSCRGFGTKSGVIAGVDRVTANHVKPAVANMSLGAVRSPAIDRAVKGSIETGVTYAVAAGNENANACFFSPANVGPALRVGASDIADRRASFSNKGACVDLFAPGVSIASAWATSDTATSTISGTSMASPHVAGVAALYMSTHPDAAPAEVTGAVVLAATTGRLSGLGFRSPNLLLYSEP